MTRSLRASCVVFAMLSVGACQRGAGAVAPRASGYVEATEIRLASKVPGRVDTVTMAEGTRVEPGDVLVVLSTTETDLALNRARAERAQADAQARLLRAGARAEDVRQAQAQAEAAVSDERAANAELASARIDETRFEQLLEKKAGAAKQRDDAVARRELADARARAAADRLAAARAAVDRVRSGARPEELEVADARVHAIDADIATLNQKRADAVIVSPAAGIVTSRRVEPGELVAVGVPVAIIVDLDRAWVNAYVEAPLVPLLTLSQTVTVVTDAGQRMKGQIAFIAPRAEFTPRNVQTSAERAKLVYRVKVTVDNREGILKPGMPVEVLLGADAGA